MLTAILRETLERVRTLMEKMAAENEYPPPETVPRSLAVAISAKQLRRVLAVVFEDSDTLRIQRMDATGGVFVTRGAESANGDVAIYDFNKRIITMVGNVRLKRANGDNLNGGRMVIDLSSGVSSVNGGSNSAGQGGRVSGSFAVPKRGN